MFIELIQKFNLFNEWIFAPLDGVIERLFLAEWIKDAIIDSLHMLPFLLFIFFIIGLVEYFYFDKTELLASKSEKAGPLFGSLVASVPQCGFSVIASTLYTRRLITKGTLLGVYLATSDEAIPVLMASPEMVGVVMPLIGIKVLIGIVAGYLTDFIFRNKTKTFEYHKKIEVSEDKNGYDGCCRHNITNPSKEVLFFHPIIHTVNVFVFIFLVTLFLNYLVMLAGGEENLGRYFMGTYLIQPFITAIMGLIPNCAVSIAITLMYVKGVIDFGAVISGLCSSAGLGLLVLLKNNKDKKDTLSIIFILLFISVISGFVVRLICS